MSGQDSNMGNLSPRRVDTTRNVGDSVGGSGDSKPVLDRGPELPAYDFRACVARSKAMVVGGVGSTIIGEVYCMQADSEGNPRSAMFNNMGAWYPS